MLALVIGGILGGIAIWRHGLKAWLWPMAFALNGPDLLYVYLAWAQPDSYPLITSLIAVESFGYGFGFSAYMMYMIRLAEGQFKTAHYAFGNRDHGAGGVGHPVLERGDAGVARLPGLLRLGESR